jgi:acyl carrier protein
MTDERVRAILKAHGNLTANALELLPNADLYAAGLTSFATVQLMLALEEEFNVEIPEKLLNRRTFQSIEAISNAIKSILPLAKSA